jgi:formylglycine-generating enzyme required for sulfatase activity
MQVKAEQEGSLRGGSWAYFRPECLRSSYRYRVPATLRMPTIGFRCVFEDKQRSAALLATLETNRQKIRDERREIMTGGPVNKEEVEAMKKKLMAGDAADTLPDPSKLAPMQPGKAFKNSLGMELVPALGQIHVATTEVRVQDYEVWLKSADRSWESKPSFLLGGTHPAAGLSWKDAQDFCLWLTKRERDLKLIRDTATYRLPSDTEWSQLAGLKEETGADPAARSGGNKTHFPWSTHTFPPPPMSANLDAQNIPDFTDSYSYTAPVNAEEPNELGIHGLAGNVAEWCSDPWPGADAERVIRGGSWLTSDKEKMLTSNRRHASVDQTTPDVGFRVVLENPAP